jgi:SAM-dependent methyltransferase
MGDSAPSVNSGPRLYRELAEWYPLLTPVSDYAEEAAFYRRLFESHCHKPPRTLLDLGCGGGHNAAHLKATLACTLVDLAPAMLAISRRLNPECEHVLGDMRSVRLGRVFDCVLMHDAVSYMASRADLACAMVTAFEHTAPGGPPCSSRTSSRRPSSRGPWQGAAMTGAEACATWSGAGSPRLAARPT